MDFLLGHPHWAVREEEHELKTIVSRTPKVIKSKPVPLIFFMRG